MNIGGNAVIVRRSGIGADGKQQYKLVGKPDAIQSNLSMYTQPDTDTITLEEFQAMGMKRLNVLKTVEMLREKYAGSHDEYRDVFREKMQTLMPLLVNGCKKVDLEAARREDRISHFILRLAFCQTQDQADWFLRQEAELFRMRFQLETPNNLQQFLKTNGIELNPVERVEKQQYSTELTQALALTSDEVDKLDLFKVDFEDVLDLLSSHRLYLQKGQAYISGIDLIALVAPRFRENISTSSSQGRRHIGFLQEEDRLIPLMNQMVRGGVTYRKEFQDPNAEQITADMVDSLARTSFPLCMRQIHFNLRHEHHLRHFARRQYGVFLKGIGLSLEESMTLFRGEFTKKMDSEKFTKQYAYNIRHIYGKEGSRIEQKPFSCATIILGSAPAAQDCHGCPYKHSDVATLSKQLEGVGLKSDQVRSIVDLSKMNRFDKACTKYFEYTQNVPDMEDLITHPNQYYSLSRKVQRGQFITSKTEQKMNEEDEEMPE